MNQSELKEHIKHLQFLKTLFPEGSDIEALSVAVDFLQQYLDIKEPEEKEAQEGVFSITVEGVQVEPDVKDHVQRDFYYIAGFNEALHLAKLAQMKKLEGLEEAGETFREQDDFDLKGFCAYIRQHMGGK